VAVAWAKVSQSAERAMAPREQPGDLGAKGRAARKCMEGERKARVKDGGAKAEG